MSGPPWRHRSCRGVLGWQPEVSLDDGVKLQVVHQIGGGTDRRLHLVPGTTRPCAPGPHRAASTAPIRSTPGSVRHRRPAGARPAGRGAPRTPAGLRHRPRRRSVPRASGWKPARRSPRRPCSPALSGTRRRPRTRPRRRRRKPSRPRACRCSASVPSPRSSELMTYGTSLVPSRWPGP